MNYKQCKLVKGAKEQTSWIPERFAKKNKTIKIFENDVWEDGWVVEFVGASKSEEYLSDFKDIYRTHRKVTDI